MNLYCKMVLLCYKKKKIKKKIKDFKIDLDLEKIFIKSLVFLFC